MPDEEERIDIGAELGAKGKLDDQLLRDLKDVAKAEHTRKTVDSKKTAQSAANKKKLNLYITIGAVSAVVLLIVAYFVIVRGDSQTVKNNTSGPQRIPQTTIAAPVTTTAPTAPTNTRLPASTPPPSSGQEAGGYEPPM